MVALWHLLVHAAGCDAGAPYGTFVPADFWAGIAGSFAVGLAVCLPAWWWRNQCTVHHCYWPARRTTAAGERACFRHHPHPKRTVEDLHAAHHAALEGKS